MSELQDAEKEKTSAEQNDEHNENINKNEPASQTLLDLEASGLTPEDMVEAARAAAVDEKKRPAQQAALPCFRWLVLLLLSAAGGLALAWSGDEENIRLWGLAGIILLLLLISALPAARLCPRLPTRGGLAAALLSAAFFIQTIEGWPKTFFQTCPATMVWAGLLTLALLWTIAAAFRKLGGRPITILVGLLLVYAASGPVTALVSHFFGPGLTWEVLNTSPDFLTGILPWYLWPTALTLGLALPLAALLSLGDQWSSLRRPGARHGGNFFLALAWLGLLPSGLLLFSPAADHYPDLVKKIQGLAPVLAGVEPAPVAPAVIPQPPAAVQPPPVQPKAATVPEETLEPEPIEPTPATAPDTPPPSEPLAADPPALPPDSVAESAPPPSEPQTKAAEAQPAATPEDLITARLKELQLTARLEELQRRNETLEFRVDDLEARLQLLSDRLNQLERPEQPRNLTPPLPPELETPKNLTTPDQPLAAPPKNGENEWETPYHGGSAT